MKKILYSQTDSREFIKKILLSYFDKSKYTFFLFWSRAKWTNNAYSDWDIGIQWKEYADIRSLMKVRSILEETPRRVDIVDFKKVSEEFKKNACQVMEKL